ncbi:MULTISPECIES: assimilatory sulfite reductase (NADPH) flavoprotein subunit [Paenibacillus]|uniref:assimilatory sulfite reductase (NADPH) n=2 Tax=Paenibacillus lactis TaxID=228574 RepID=G4HGI7_9BACL|nr:assimilatory sulfite reductase (NADPH) flavoprotein subunit [Paenibacillus lactis]EHB63860.1 sulfite reductase (NADPH) flavoprotein, alpha chain [Paenibacillus lactis 154]MBP1894880.1 sulfite reductase (NADPH) flavoprotein alpha-component [Paenibacillus lactis]HAF96883.1 assimilatory sulfite reductase (NADPH) flavoprotein subunit [Paenibacillus lactis]
MELQVTNSPFNQEQVDLLNRLLPTLTEAQRTWLSGYITALQSTAAALAIPAAATQATVSVSAAPAAAAPKEITVLFGSQTGNCHGLAKKLTKKLEETGMKVTLSSMSDFKPNTLKKLQHLLILVSTHGEGEPPDNAIPFYEFLHSKRAPQLDGLQYSVLALGDTSYEFFCQTGKDFDKRLEELGGQRLAPRVDCDVDFDEPASEWMTQVLRSLNQSGGLSAASGEAAAVALSESTESEYSRSNPFQAEVLENMNLNGRGSERETRHIEISLEGSNLQYEPGDSLGIYPENHPLLVDELITAMGWNADEEVVINKNGEVRKLRDALLRHYEITVLTKPLIEQVAKLTGHEGLKGLLEPGHEQELRNYIQERDLLDLVQDYGLREVPARDLVGVLRKIPARLYSIASSPKAYPDEVHITVRTVRYEAHGRNRYGVCSVQLAERLQAGDALSVYIQHNPNFKLPANPDTPIIMIGPGTGVAPFRAFLGEREETGASGKSWLFYGDQHFATDFLYQIEWQRWLKEGVLTRMDVAFSRDTEQKVYVQHRMLENSKELYQWLQEGACVYVCGDEKKMAHDVHAALGTILEQEGGLSPEEASEYLTLMQQQKRYQRDVY